MLSVAIARGPSRSGLIQGSEFARHLAHLLDGAPVLFGPELTERLLRTALRVVGREPLVLNESLREAHYRLLALPLALILWVPKTRLAL